MKNKIKIIYNYFIIPTFIIMILFFYYAHLNNVNLQTISFKSYIFSLIIIDLINIILLFIFKDSKKAHITIIIFLILITIINQLKISYMSTPLFISDLNFLNNYENITTFTKGSIFKILGSILLKSIPFFILFIFLALFIYYFNFKIERKNIKYITPLAAIALVLLLYPFSFSRVFITNLIYKDKMIPDLNTYNNYKVLYGYYGVIGGMHYQSFRSKNLTKLEDYDENKLEQIEEKSKKESSILNRPNIIVILSESFFDISKLKDNITFNKDITYNYNRLKKEGNYINVISPTLGSNTSNVSFEFLTGSNVSYFDSGFIPFIDLYKDNKTRPSLVSVLKNNGYNTSIIMGEDSYNSEKVMKNIGFSNYMLVNSNKHNKGKYVSDDYLADLIINNMNKNINKKNFIMVETMENHMEYNKDKFSKYDIDIKKSNLTKKDQYTLKSYAQGTYDADKMLNKIYNYIKSINNNTIVIFFGDHLPFLRNSDGSDVFSNLDYFNTNNNLINTYRLYNTESLILSNYDMKIDFPKYMGYEFILTSILNNMDINIPNYYKWLYSTRKVLPTYNHLVAVNSDNKIVYTNNLKNKDKNMYNLRKNMIYKEFIDK